MRTLAAMVTLALLGSGCLYVGGDINDQPSAALEIDPAVVDRDHVTLFKGQSLHLVAHMRDPEDGYDVVPHWHVAAVDSTGYTPDVNCDATLIPDSESTSPDPGSATATVILFRTGTWMVTFWSSDRFGAKSTSTASVMVPVIDAPPKFSLATTQLRTTVGKDPECMTYVAGQPLPMVLDGAPNRPPVEDADQTLLLPNVACDPARFDETLRYTWKLLGMPASSHAVIGPKPSTDASHPTGDAPCPVAAPAGLGPTWSPGAADFPFAACVYPDVGGTASPDMYEVAVFASDGKTEIRSDLFDAQVRADLPPCMTGASPAAGSYVVDRAEPQHFIVTGVADDLDPFPSAKLTFAWSLWRESDPTWRQVPSYALPTFTLDASGFNVGEKVRVRAEAVDRAGQRASCDADLDACTTDSCLLGPGATCQEWITWDLELR